MADRTTTPCISTIAGNIRDHLIAWPGLSDVGERVYYRRMPQDVTFPVITFSRISNNRTYSQDGYSFLQNSRFQFTIWSPDPDQVDVLGEELVACMHEYPFNEYQGVFAEMERDEEDPETALFMRILDFKIWNNT